MMKHIHFIGIGGSGASAAAAIAQAQGFIVTGCDKNINQEEFTKPFKKGQLYAGHNPKHLACNLEGCSVNILAVTPAILSLDPDNDELQEARKREIEISTWQEFLGKYLLKDKFVIAVTGTHGKSTTTAMIGKLLEDAGLDPTVELGAIVPGWKSNFRIGKGRYFVVEADEFNDNFLNYTPDITVVTNIEMDHPEFFIDLNHYKESFNKFLLKTKRTIVANISDANIAGILKTLMKESPVKVIDYSKNEINFELEVIGKHNKLNAQAVLQVGLLLGITPDVIQKSLQSYTGVGRRFEHLGKYKGADVYSDFGHHPTEIKTTVLAVREKFPDRKIWLIYEPHMFTRTKAFFDDFVKVFRSIPADQTIILDIYPSREIDTGKVKSWQIAQSVKKPNVRYNSPEEIKETLNKEVEKGDVLLFMGAGDIDKLAGKLAGL